MGILVEFPFFYHEFLVSILEASVPGVALGTLPTVMDPLPAPHPSGVLRV